MAQDRKTMTSLLNVKHHTINPSVFCGHMCQDPIFVAKELYIVANSVNVTTVICILNSIAKQWHENNEDTLNT